MTPQRTRLSVVIPTKNRPDDILRCLASVYEHSPDVEDVVIVDQSSTRYELPAYPRLVHVFDQSLSGASAARNAGAAAATGDVLLFIDDDCLFRNDVVTAVIAAFDANPDAVGVQAQIVDEDFIPTPLSARIFEHGFFNTNEFGPAHDLRRLAGAGCAYRAWVFEHVRFDEDLKGYSYGEDYDMAIRARRLGRLVFAPDGRVQHAASQTNRFDRLRSFQIRWKNLNYIYAKNRAHVTLLDRVWYRWWQFGETLQWLRFGLGWPRMPS